MLVLHQSESAVVEGDSDHHGGKIPMDDDNQECIQRALSTEATDKYSTLSPEQLSSESIRLLLSCNILQKDPKDSSRVKVVDYSH